MPPKTRSHPRRRAKKAPKNAKKAVSFAIDTAPAPRVDPVEEVLSNQPLLEHVLSFLPMNVDIGRAASTNKAFKEACDSPAMWKARAERLPILTLRDCDVDIIRLNHQLTKAVDNPGRYWYFEDMDCEEYADDLAEAYLLFMTLRRDTHPRVVFQPPPLIDEAWHAHILNTRNYKEFCMREFGYFVHHTPGDGTRGFNMVNYKNVLQSLAEKKISHPDGAGTLSWKLIEVSEFFPSIEGMYGLLEDYDTDEDYGNECGCDDYGG